MARYFVGYPKEKQGFVVEQRMRIAASGDYERWAKAPAGLYQMIYRQPVRSEHSDLALPVLIAVGAQDRKVVMKRYGDPGRAAGTGSFPALARAACAEVKDCTAAVIGDSGHVPHLERPEALLAALDAFLR